MVSCTYAIGRIELPDFFHRGKVGEFWRIPVYSNTKLALLLFTIELSKLLRDKGITVNAADPGKEFHHHCGTQSLLEAYPEDLQVLRLFHPG